MGAGRGEEGGRAARRSGPCSASPDPVPSPFPGRSSRGLKGLDDPPNAGFAAQAGALWPAPAGSCVALGAAPWPLETLSGTGSPSPPPTPGRGAGRSVGAGAERGKVPRCPTWGGVGSGAVSGRLARVAGTCGPVPGPVAGAVAQSERPGLVIAPSA